MDSDAVTQVTNGGAAAGQVPDERWQMEMVRRDAVYQAITIHGGGCGDVARVLDTAKQLAAYVVGEQPAAA